MKKIILWRKIEIKSPQVLRNWTALQTRGANDGEDQRSLPRLRRHSSHRRHLPLSPPEESWPLKHPTLLPRMRVLNPSVVLCRTLCGIWKEPEAQNVGMGIENDSYSGRLRHDTPKIKHAGYSFSGQVAVTFLSHKREGVREM